MFYITNLYFTKDGCFIKKYQTTHPNQLKNITCDTLIINVNQKQTEKEEEAPHLPLLITLYTFYYNNNILAK